MALLLAATTTRNVDNLEVDFTTTPTYINELSDKAKRQLSHMLMCEARRLWGGEHRHEVRPEFTDAAEDAIMSSDMVFDSVIDLDNAMCFTALGMQIERERQGNDPRSLHP